MGALKHCQRTVSSTPKCPFIRTQLFLQSHSSHDTNSNGGMSHADRLHHPQLLPISRKMQEPVGHEALSTAHLCQRQTATHRCVVKGILLLHKLPAQIFACNSNQYIHQIFLVTWVRAPTKLSCIHLLHMDLERAVLPESCFSANPADLQTQATRAFVTQCCRCIRSSPLLERSAISNMRVLVRMPRRLLVPLHHLCNGTNKPNALTPSARNRVFLLRCRRLWRCRIFNN